MAMAAPKIELLRKEVSNRGYQESSEQSAVIAHQGSPLAVFGGPGTGKTATLIRKVVKLIEGGIDPNSILVLAYGRERASEIRDEIVLQSGATAFEPLVRTFHSLAFSIINQKSDSAKNKYVLISGAEQDAFIRELLETDASRALWPKELQSALATKGFAREVRDLILRAQERGLTIEELRKKSLELNEPWWGAAADFWSDYDEALYMRYATLPDTSLRVDTSQIISKAIERLNKDSVLLNKLRENFKYILVDEFQESDKSQRALLNLLHGENLTLFIDTDSTIGVFRGADPDGLFKYLGSKNFKELRLTKIFRSSTEINKLAAAVSANFRSTSPSRVRETESTVSAGGISATKLTSASESANLIAHKLRSAHLKDGVPWSQMAILVRSPGASVQALSRALSLNNIPVEIDASALALNENPAVRPLITIARIVLGELKLNVANWPEIEELLRSEYGGADSLSLRAMRLSLSKLRTEADPKSSLAMALEVLESGIAPIEHDAFLSLLRIAELINAGRKALRNKGDITDIFAAIWSVAKNYDGKLIAELWRQTALNGGPRGAAADRDLDAVIQLFEIARRFTERMPLSKPKQFIEQITSESILSDAITAKGVREEVVSILTVHSAKGREWEIVALAGLQEGVWPNYKQRGTLLGSERLVENLRTGLTARDEIESGSRSALIEDERRLFYVAVTRAKSELIAVGYTEEDSESSAYFEEIYEYVHGNSSYESEPVRSPRALSQQAVIAELRGLAESGDKTSAAVLNLLAAHKVSAADPKNWLGVKELSSNESAIDKSKKVSVSPSNLQNFSECGLKWFIERSGGRDGDSSAQLIGSAIHGVAEKFMSDPDISLDKLKEYISENWKLIDQNRGWVKDYELRDAFEKIEKLYYWHDKNKKERKLIAVEAKFEKELGRAFFNGSVDRIELDGDGKIYIVDLKSGSGSDVTKEDAKENKQLAGYQLAVLEEAFKNLPIKGEVAGSALVYLGSDAKSASVKSQDPIDHQEVLADVKKTAEEMAASEFVAKINKRCRKCPVKNICPIHATGRSVLDGD